MSSSNEKPAALSRIDEDSPDDFSFPKGGSARKKLPDATPPVPTGTRRKKMSKRIRQFSTKADPELLARFYATLDEIEVSTTIGFEMALKEFIEGRPKSSS